MSRLVIEAGKAERHYWADLWKYRELFYFLSWRDILVRYKQTVFGILWAVLKPVLTTIIFVAFGKFARINTEGANTVVFVFAGMLPWNFFSAALTDASNSLIVNANMISKIYFPRLIVPAGSVIVALTDLLISLAILSVIMAWNHVVPTWRIFFLVPFTGLAFLAAFGAGLWLSALNVEYRDFRYVVPFITQLGIYISPVPYGMSLVPENLRLVYSLNPLVGIINGYRWAITGQPNFLDWPSIGISILVVSLITAGGVWYFRKTERAFADVI